jgi:hypothetical protein
MASNQTHQAKSRRIGERFQADSQLCRGLTGQRLTFQWREAAPLGRLGPRFRHPSILTDINSGAQPNFR